MKREYLIAGFILTTSFSFSGYLLWASNAGPVAGDIREIETEDHIILQQAKGRWFAPNYWEDSIVTQKNLSGPSWLGPIETKSEGES